MINEIWQYIPGYENLYLASNFGIIKRVIGYNCRKERILKPAKDKGGYLKIALSKENNLKSHRVHRIILITFIGPCPVGMECRHLDGNPTNNRLDNLCWGTKSENQKDNIRHGTNWLSNNRLHTSGSKHPFSKLTEKDIPEIRRLIRNGLTNIEIAKIFKVNRQTIRDIKLNRSWKHII